MKYVICTPNGFIPKGNKDITLDLDEAKLTKAEVEVKTEGLTRYRIIEVNE